MLIGAKCKGEYHEFGGEGIAIVGRAEQVCDSLLNEYGEKVQLIYLDPPFGAGGAFEFKDRTAVYAYTDKFDAESYLAMMKKVLECSYELLTPSGSIYLHVDYRVSGKLRIMMDEIFGESNFVNEIIWSYKLGGRATKHFSRKHDTILFYRKSKAHYFNINASGMPRGRGRRNHMKRRVDEDGRIYYAIKSGGREYRYYEDDLVYPSDVWDDIEQLHQRDPERTGYSAQKPEALLKRIISSSSMEGDIVMDLFAGSGTTAAVSAKLNRKFIMVDCGMASLLAIRRRLLALERNNEFFTEPASLEIRYMDENDFLEEENAERIVKFHEISGGVFVSPNSTEDYGCSYVASGRVENGIYHAEEYIIKPFGDEKLFVPHGKVLHIADSACRHGFFEMKCN